MLLVSESLGSQDDHQLCAHCLGIDHLSYAVSESITTATGHTQLAFLVLDLYRICPGTQTVCHKCPHPVKNDKTTKTSYD